MGRQCGFAYLFLLFALAIMTISALALGSLQYYERVRSNEAELLRIGGEFRRALVSYRDANALRMYPASIDGLLLDRRGGGVRRHLRKLYVDPVTNSQEWKLVIENGGIVGIHSLSERTPFKIAGFDPENADFEGAQRYADWVFRVSPPQRRGVGTDRKL